MVSLQPEFGPLNADQEPTQLESDALDDITAEVLKFIHGDYSDDLVSSVANAPEFYQGVGAAAFTVLDATKSKFESGGVKVPPATLFGEGGAIHTTVDEIIQLMRAAGVPGAEDPDQYSASMMEVMRLAGEHIEKTNDDESVSEAQELLIDIESTGQPGVVPESEDEGRLKGAIQRSLDAQNQALGPLPETPSPLPTGEGIAPNPNNPPLPQDPNAEIAPADGGILNG
jgi:hypothetical protein